MSTTCRGRGRRVELARSLASAYGAAVLEIVRFALSAYFPREGDLPGLAELDLDEKIAALRRDTTVLFWVGVVAASIFFQLTPLFTVHRPVPAALLSEDELDAHAHKLATSRLYGI